MHDSNNRETSIAIDCVVLPSCFVSRMSLYAVEITGLSAIHDSATTVVLKLHFSPHFQPKQDDVILLLPVDWSELHQARHVLYPNGNATVDFSTGEVATNDSDFNFQFVYFQDDAAVGRSRSFCLRKDHDIPPFLDTNAPVVTSHDASLTQTPVEDIDTVQTVLKTQATDAESRRSTKFDQHQEVTSSTPVFASQLDDHHAVGSKSTCAGTDSFVCVALPAEQELAGYEKERQAQFTASLSDRNRISKLYEREKAFRVIQESKNTKLQSEYDRALAENRQLKKELEHVESEVEETFLRLRSSKQQTGIPQLEQATCFTSPINKISLGSQRLERSDEANFATSDESADTDKLRIADTRGSNQISSCNDVFTCPVCLKAFDERDGTARFQLHVHGHFSDEDYLFH
ncbi:uncharacterized protein LOC134195051 [Corticium candelabrum]|uniref:uncharacterized protein LOC134195051 n=1 Tax=Corticium candelabrum TaxID=121492 RepID=UPI002E26D029|nr:uncharacterized protein LOC134195051 [Corticium candelabrum]